MVLEALKEPEPKAGDYVRVTVGGKASTGFYMRHLTKPVDLRDGSIMFVHAGYEIISQAHGRLEIGIEALRWSDAERRWEAQASPLDESPTCLP